MRAPLVLVGALAVSLVAACGAVPDLRFGDDGNGDGGAGVSQDATIPIVVDGSVAPGGDDSSSSSTGDDSSIPVTTDGDASEDGPAPPIADANGLPEAAPDPCPSHPPFGVTCCGAMECRPNGFVPCDCKSCTDECAATPGTPVCCIDKNSKFQQCAASIAACPKP